MDHELIIRLAREAGMADSPDNYHSHWTADDVGVLERFAALVAEQEREACARVAEKHWDNLGIGQRIAAAIRSRT